MVILLTGGLQFLLRIVKSTRLVPFPGCRVHPGDQRQEGGMVSPPCSYQACARSPSNLFVEVSQEKKDTLPKAIPEVNRRIYSVTSTNVHVRMRAFGSRKAFPAGDLRRAALESHGFGRERSYKLSLFIASSERCQVSCPMRSEQHEHSDGFPRVGYSARAKFHTIHASAIIESSDQRHDTATMPLLFKPVEAFEGVLY